MSLSTIQVAHLLAALGLVTLSAHTVGYLFARLRQPAVLGEIVGGLLLGPTAVCTTAGRIAVALNARGTPGVLVATVTLGAGVINERFFAALVLMSIVTCQIAGFWLDRAFRDRPPTAVRPNRTPDAKEIA
jgi:Kef-type K+ transport system membrane component KefB